jgi:hypothetical protein
VFALLTVFAAKYIPPLFERTALFPRCCVSVGRLDSKHQKPSTSIFSLVFIGAGLLGVDFGVVLGISAAFLPTLVSDTGFFQTGKGTTGNRQPGRV